LKIFIKNIDEKNLCFIVNPNNTIRSLKHQIEKYNKINTDDQCLIYNSKIVKDEFTIKDYNICDKNMLVLKLYEKFIINISSGNIDLYNIKNEKIDINFDENIY
jgi:hypothetical protein